MAGSITDELKNTFALATLRRESLKILNADEWKVYQKITNRFADQKRFEQRAFELEYKTRVEVARKRLINQAGQVRKSFQPVWARNDRFDRDAITRQAHRQVKAGFKQLMEKFEVSEVREIEGLLNRSEHRRKLREKPRHDFARAVDRRRGMERRQTRSRRLTR